MPCNRMLVRIITLFTVTGSVIASAEPYSVSELAPEARRCLEEFLRVVPNEVTISTSGEMYGGGLGTTILVSYHHDGREHECQVCLDGNPPYVRSARWRRGGPALQPPWDVAACRFMDRVGVDRVRLAEVRLLGCPGKLLAYGWEKVADGERTGACAGVLLAPDTGSVLRYTAFRPPNDVAVAAVTRDEALRIAATCIGREYVPNTATWACLVGSSPLQAEHGPVWIVRIGGSAELAQGQACTVLIVDAVDGGVLGGQQQ